MLQMMWVPPQIRLDPSTTEIIACRVTGGWPGPVFRTHGAWSRPYLDSRGRRAVPSAGPAFRDDPRGIEPRFESHCREVAFQRCPLLTTRSIAPCSRCQ